VARTDPISVPQKDYIRGLIEKRDITGLEQAQRDFLAPQTGNVEDDEALFESNLDRMTNGQASTAIQLLLSCPWKPKVPENATLKELVPENIRTGYFFITDPTNQQERFFRVTEGKEGSPLEPYFMLDVQASDYFYPVKKIDHKMAVFGAISVDPIKSMNEYGMRLGRCGVCNRTLTDRGSILKGIGPICEANLGPTQDQENMLRKLGLIKDNNDA